MIEMIKVNVTRGLTELCVLSISSECSTLYGTVLLYYPCTRWCVRMWCGIDASASSEGRYVKDSSSMNGEHGTCLSFVGITFLIHPFRSCAIVFDSYFICWVKVIKSFLHRIFDALLVALVVKYVRTPIRSTLDINNVSFDSMWRYSWWQLLVLK